MQFGDYTSYSQVNVQTSARPAGQAGATISEIVEQRSGNLGNVCQQIRQQFSTERVEKSFAELRRIVLEKCIEALDSIGRFEC